MTQEKRTEAIKWLKEEIRSLRLAPKINGCGPENWADLLEVMETCLEAVRGYGSEPLTMEQLREMDGQPVWLSVAGGVWGLVNVFDNCAVLSTGGDIKLRSLSGYAFSYPPAESWYELEKMVRELD